MNTNTGPLPWQDAAWTRVTSARASGRLGHALLLAGPAGVGKARFARALAALLLCENAGADATVPCGKCRGCAQMAASQHPNLQWLRRELNDKGDREKRDISMDQVRAMQERIALAGHYGRPKCVVIEPAEALNLSGVNAVLKTVEEPPPDTYLLLLSERPMSLLATLRSRCQRIALPAPEFAQAQGWLSEQAPELDATVALAAAGGAPLAALDAARNGLAEQRVQWRKTLLEVASRRRDPLAGAAGVGRDSVPEWLDTLARLLHQCLRGQAGAAIDAPLGEVAARIEPRWLEQLLAELGECRRRLNSNPNPQLLVESLMIAWWHHTAPARGRNASNRTAS